MPFGFQVSASLHEEFTLSFDRMPLTVSRLLILHNCFVIRITAMVRPSGIGAS